MRRKATRQGAATIKRDARPSTVHRTTTHRGATALKRDARASTTKISLPKIQRISFIHLLH